MFPVIKYNIVGAKIMPTTKVIRHANSKEDAGEINLLKIPLKGKTSSLNASVAAAISLYELSNL